MERTNEIKGNKVIYPELSYKITGILFRVQNTIGVGHKERVYESAIAAAFTEEHIPFERQMYVPVMMGDERVGYYYLDFLVGNKIILELKSGNRFLRQDIEQVYRYLKTNNLQLGILARFTDKEVIFKQVLNIHE